MFSTNPFTRRRQQVMAALVAVSGIASALALVGITQHRPQPTVFAPREAASGPWTATITSNQVVVIRNRDTGSLQSVVFALPQYWSKAGIEAVTGVAVSGDEVLIASRQIVGAQQGVYILRDCVDRWDARTGKFLKSESR